MPRTDAAVILVPIPGVLTPECDDALRELERQGYAVWRGRDGSSRDVAHNRMTADALAHGFEELIWVDPDIAFQPDDIDRLRGHGRPCVGGLYPQAGRRQIAAQFLPGTAHVTFGESAALIEVRSVGFGFTLVRRAVFDAVRAKAGLPECTDPSGRAFVPYFLPLVARDGAGKSWYHADTDAFCHRAREAGVPVQADPGIRLWRVGSYRYGWEDAGSDKERFPQYTFHLTASPTTAAAVPPPPAAPATQTSVTVMPGKPRGAPARKHLRPEASRLPDTFPTFQAYVLTYPANRESAERTVEDFRQSDWGEEPHLFVQPEDWPREKKSGAMNRKRAMEHAVQSGCDFALFLEDDVRVNRHLRYNLSHNPLVRRDQCDHLSLFIPDLIKSPWEREEPHLGYRVARPLYTGPNKLWQKTRLWGSQAYLLSRRFILTALGRWDHLTQGQDSRVLAVCKEQQVTMYYTDPCLIQHVPEVSAFKTPITYAPDFDPDYRLAVGGGFQPPEQVPGWFTLAEGRLLWETAAGKDVLELGTSRGRSTVCLAQSAKSAVTVDIQSQAEAEEWVRRYGCSDKVTFHQEDVAEVCARLDRKFDLVFIDTEHDAASVRRDIAAAKRLLTAGGLLAFHDYPEPGWPDVRRVVDEEAKLGGWKRVAQADYLGVFRVADR